MALTPLCRHCVASSSVLSFDFLSAENFLLLINTNRLIAQIYKTTHYQEITGGGGDAPPPPPASLPPPPRRVIVAVPRWTMEKLKLSQRRVSY